MMKIDLSLPLPRPVADGLNIRTANQWRSYGRSNGHETGQRTARAWASNNHGTAVLLWDDGWVTVYAMTETGDVARIRYSTSPMAYTGTEEHRED